MLIAGLAIVIATLGLSACAESPRSTQGVSEVKEGRVRLLAGEVAIIDQRVNKRQKYWRFTYDGSNTVYMDRRDNGWLDSAEHYELYVKDGETVEPDLGWLVSSVKVTIGSDQAAYIDYDTGWLSSWTYYPPYKSAE